jgi:hypothetical protein
MLPWPPGIMSCVPNVDAVWTDLPMEGADLPSDDQNEKKLGNNPRNTVVVQCLLDQEFRCSWTAVTQGHTAPGSRTANAGHFGHKPSRKEQARASEALRA